MLLLRAFVHHNYSYLVLFLCSEGIGYLTESVHGRLDHGRWYLEPTQHGQQILCE